MLYLVTGVPGASKTAFVVTELDKIENSNKINLLKNIEIYKHNLKLYEKYKQDFSYYEIELGSGHLLKTKIEVLDDDYFSMLGQEYDDLRPDDYFLRSVRYNEIIERIEDRDGEQGFKQFLPVRTIYTNIKALKIPFSRANVYDWRECPDGSIIVIDEVQLVEPYSDLKNKTNDIVQELTIHRHRGFDFYFITQAPSLLHPTIKELIGCHFHITRPYGLTPKVYRFGSCRAYPNTFVNKLNCEDKFNFKPQDRIFKLYKSTSINTHKGRIPKGVFIFLSIALLCIFGSLYMITSKDMGLLGDMANVATGQEIQKNQQQAKKENTTVLANDNQNQQDTNTIQSQQVAQTEKMIEKLMIVGCIQQDKRCNCYHEQGGIIDMPLNECKRYMDGYKPYYVEKRYSNSTMNNPTNTTNSTNTQSEEATNMTLSSHIINEGSNNSSYFQAEQTELLGLTSYER